MLFNLPKIIPRSAAEPRVASSERNRSANLCDRSSCWGQGSKVSYRASCCLARTYTTVGRVPGPWPLRTGYVRVFDDLVVLRVYDGKEGKWSSVRVWSGGLAKKSRHTKSWVYIMQNNVVLSPNFLVRQAGLTFFFGFLYMLKYNRVRSCCK